MSDLAIAAWDCLQYTSLRPYYNAPAIISGAEIQIDPPGHTHP